MADEEELSDVLAAALADVAEGVTVPQDRKLEIVAHWINKQTQLEDLFESLEEQAKKVKEQLREISDKKLPEALLDAGCSKFETPEGLGVKIDDIYESYVLIENRPAFCDWLVENGHEGLIKTSVAIEYGKGDYPKAKELRARLESLLDEYDVKVPAAPVLKGDIHHATLRAFVKEQSKSGFTEWPEIISVYAAKRAKITRPKS